MRFAVYLLLLCSSRIALSQVQPKAQPEDRMTAFVAPASLYLTRTYDFSCPLGMKAERQASEQREWIVSLEDAPQPQRPNMRANKAGVHVELVGFKSKPMKQAEVAVYYMAPGVRVLPASQDIFDTTEHASDSTKTFVLSAANGESNMQLAGSLLVGNAASITRVRLLRIEYSDGTTWQAKDTNHCAVEPGLLMLTAGR